MLRVYDNFEISSKNGRTVRNMVLHLGKQSVTSEDLNLELKQLNGTNAIQGVSGQIAFGPDNGNPINKAIIMLSVDSQGHIQMDHTLLGGQFIKST